MPAVRGMRSCAALGCVKWRYFVLLLITGAKPEMYTHSMMRNIPGLYEQFPENLLEINPEMAAGLGIGDGDVAGSSAGRM